MTSGKRTYLPDLVEAARKRGYDVDYAPDVAPEFATISASNEWVSVFALDGFFPDDHAKADVFSVETGAWLRRFYDAPEILGWLDDNPPPAKAER